MTKARADDAEKEPAEKEETHLSERENRWKPAPQRVKTAPEKLFTIFMGYCP
jgi:hypothetical protein